MAFESPYLEPQSVTIPFVGGLDNKTDRKSVEPPKLLDLHNASFFVPGEISKDRGYPQLTASQLGGAISSSAVYRTIGCNGKQLLFTDRHAFTYMNTADRFASLVAGRGIWATCSVETTGLNREFEGDMHDYAVVNGYELIVVYSSGSAAMEYAIRERATGTILYTASAAMTGAGIRGAAFATGNILGVTWLNGANVNVLVWDTTSPSTSPATTTPITDATGNYIDAFPQATNVVAIACAQNATGRLKVILRNVATATTTQTSTATVANIDRCLTVACLANSNVFVVWGDSATGLRGAGFSNTLASLGTALLDGGVLNYTHCTAIEYSGGWAVVYRNGTTSALQTLTATNAAVATLLAGTVFGFDGLAHRAVRPANTANAFCFGAVKNSTLVAQPESYFATIWFDPGRPTEMDPLCFYLRSLALNAPNNSLSNCMLDGSEFRWGAGERQNVQVSGTGWTFTKATSIASFRIDDGSAVPFSSTVAMAGGVSVPEHPGVTSPSDLQPTSLPFAPMIVSATGAAGGALTALGTYSVRAVYEVIDVQGNVIQSEPSLPVSVTLAAGQNTINVVVRTPYCRFGGSGPTTIIYRTQAAGTTYNRDVIGLTTALTATNQTIACTQADAAILPNQALYTDAGVLENGNEPHGRMLVLHQDRAFKIDEHSGELRYTKEVAEGEGLAWHPNLALDLRNNGIDGKALVSTNNGLWIFGRDLNTGLGGIHFLVGSGPNDSGLGSSYQLQRLEGVTVSCYDQRLCTSTPAGVLFWDPNQGFHLLVGQSAPVFVGAEIQSQMTGNNPVGMHVMLDRKEVRIPTDNVGAMAVWHYDVQQWSLREILTTPASSFVDACMWSGKHVLLGLSGTTPVIHQQSASGHDDSTQDFYAMRLDTAWFKMAGFKGLERVWKITLLGRSVTPGAATAMVAQVWYDYDDSNLGQQVTWSEADTFASMGDSGAVSLEIEPNQQEFEAFRLHLEDYVQAGVSPFGGGIAWTAIRIDFGVLKRRGRNADTAVKG